MVIFGDWILYNWVGNQVHPTLLLLLALGIWTVMNSFNGPIAMLLNGASIIRFQVITALLMGIVNLVVSILLTLALGVSGVVWGSILGQLLCVIIPSGFYIRRILRKATA